MFLNDLRLLAASRTLREMLPRAGPQGSSITIHDRRYLNFSSNDYLGLAGDDRISHAACEALKLYGLGSGASRLLAGGTDLHEQLEAAVSSLKGSEAALTFSSGYAANVGVIPAFAQEGDIIYSDELNHASIIDGCRLSKARKEVFRHKDMNHLEKLLSSTSGRRRIIISDTIFSMDGDIAPVQDLCSLSERHDALLYLDDSHGTGVLGNGKGALAHFGISPTGQIVLMGTFSKALGSFGGFIAADSDTIQWAMNKARSLIYSTSYPACIAAGSLKALKILEAEGSRVERLWDNRSRLLDRIRALGFSCGESETPILPLLMSSTEQAVDFSEALLKKGVYAPAIRPPTVKKARIRISVTAAHSHEDIDAIANALAQTA